MVLSPADRDDLVTRVEQKLGRTRVRREVIRDVVDRTLGALPKGGEPAVGRLSTIVVSAESRPDLASRVRAELLRGGCDPGEVGMASEGRYTVVTLRVPEEQRSAVESAAASLGARCFVAGGDA